ncbi:DNA-directed RNA polymerase subunit delta [Bacillus thermotolerans]|uniref:Probable DNA-directed RNA polymerase subunit delta n=1 Tax=Bacillus thermotolerans TaxID=1221996 RepID=A0A0F5I691_BACTR|nr:DNA-directed RNA polymerase subunit delta [Bacillus thermotolerans]KKB41031.1 DNA-directed RNA polymerase delta subunit [Bacillus thermotolerans]
MDLNQLSKEELQEMSMIEIAYAILEGSKQPISFQEMVDKIKEYQSLSDEQLRANVGQFYTDLNIDGRFYSLGENRWGLRAWYPVEQLEEEATAGTKTRKKKAKKVVKEEVEDDIEEIDEHDEEDLDLDEDLDDLDDLEEDIEDLDEDLDDLDEEDEDEDFEEEELTTEDDYNLDDEKEDLK